MEEGTGALTPLESLLSAKKDGAAPPPPAPEPELKVSDPPEADKPPPDPKPDSPADPEPPMIPRQAYHSEKTKRQELEAELAALKADMAKAKEAKPDPAAPTPPKMPDILDDGFGQHLEQRFAQADWNTRVTISQAMMRVQHKDYDEIEALYTEAAGQQQAPRIPMDHPNPAQFAYEIGRQIKIAREVGPDLAAYEKKLKATWEEEAKAKAEEARAAKAAEVMPTLAGERSATPDKGADGWSPKPLNDLLRQKKRT